MKTRKLLLLLLAIYRDSDDSNQGKDLDWQVQIFLAERGYVARNLYMIHVAVLGREAILLYTWL